MIGSPSQAVQAYLDHFDRVCDGLDGPDGNGAALLAHAYTQQTAMCFGGQRIAKTVRRYIGLTEDQAGTSAFEYKVRSSQRANWCSPERGAASAFNLVAHAMH